MSERIFPYQLDDAGRHMPILRIEVERAFGMPLEVRALIDSGATHSLFHAQVAEALGLPVLRGRKMTVRGIGADVEAYVHRVRVKVLDEFFECDIAFTYGLTLNQNLLGRKDFFERHHIEFREDQKTIRVLALDFLTD